MSASQSPALCDAPRFRIGDRIPGRVTRVKGVRLEERDGSTYVIYVLSDRLRRGRTFRVIAGGKG
jgi:hypothetical protein